MRQSNLSRNLGFTPSFLRGFTLTEVMVAVFILSIVLVAIFSLVTAGNRLWYTGSVLGEVQSKVRLGMEFMTKELYGAKVISPDIGTSAENISFQVPESIQSGEIVWGSTIQYSVNTDGQLIRSQADKDDKIIANDISSILFKHTESDVVIIDLTILKKTIFQQPMSAALSTQVTLRN